MMMVLDVVIMSLWKVGTSLNVTTVSSSRSGETSPLDDYQFTVSAVITELIELTPINYHDKYRRALYGGSECFGHGYCSTFITNQECRVCLQVAETKLTQKCGFAVEARMQFHDCGLVYKDDIIEEQSAAFKASLILFCTFEFYSTLLNNIYISWAWAKR